MENSAKTKIQQPIKVSSTSTFSSQSPSKPNSLKGSNFPFVSQKRLFLLIVIFLILLIGLVSGFIYFETLDRTRQKENLLPSLQKSPVASSYITYKPAQSPIIVSSPVYVSPGKQFLTENDFYRVFIINNGNTLELEGSLAIVEKVTNKEIYIKDNFVIFGFPSVGNSEDGRYLWINSGTYITRRIYLISLAEGRKKAEFCSTHGKFYFYKTYVIYANCDSYFDQGMDLTPSIIALDLIQGTKTTIFQSSSKTAYFLKEFIGNEIRVEVVYADSNHEDKIYDLTELQ